MNKDNDLKLVDSGNRFHTLIRRSEKNTALDLCTQFLLYSLKAWPRVWVAVSWVIDEVRYNQQGTKKRRSCWSHCSKMLSFVTHFTSRSDGNLSKNQTVYHRLQCIKWSRTDKSCTYKRVTMNIIVQVKLCNQSCWLLPWLHIAGTQIGRRRLSWTAYVGGSWPAPRLNTGRHADCIKVSHRLPARYWLKPTVKSEWRRANVRTSWGLL